MQVGNTTYTSAATYVQNLIRQQPAAAPASSPVVQAPPTPAPASAPAAAPPAPATVDGIRAWLNAQPGLADLAMAVDQNPTGQGLLFRRQFVMTELLSVDAADLKIVEPISQRPER